MFKIKKASQYRSVVNNILALSNNNCYPIPTFTEVNIKNLLDFKKKHGYGMNALLTKCIADTLMSDPRFKPLNSIYQSGWFSNNIIYFDNVSFSVAQDKEYEGEMVASTYELKDVNLRSLDDIDKELKDLASKRVQELPAHQKLNYLMKIPPFFLRIMAFIVANFMNASKMTMASIGFTNLGNGAIQGVFPISPKTLIFGIGGSIPRVVKVGDTFEENPILQINMTFNHYVVDGRLCNDFLTALRSKIENIS